MVKVYTAGKKKCVNACLLKYGIITPGKNVIIKILIFEKYIFITILIRIYYTCISKVNNQIILYTQILLYISR